jgi:hypothetical protein
MNVKKLLILSSLILFQSCSSNKVRIVHYNIKELNTQKIDQETDQVMKVKEVLKKHPFDILSLNEIQFDRENIPTRAAKTRGLNLQKLKRIFDVEDYNESFHPANTGANSRPKKDGDYFTEANTKEARTLADQVNFGVFPAQYSSGALFKYPIVSEIVLNKLMWKTFNPKINLKQFKSGVGLPLPTKMELFDKNFTDVIIDINGHDVHLIILHTVPSYHFGNQKSPNYERNRDQLRFLEWYLTGKTDIPVKIDSIKPLSKNDHYIAIGDWNTDYRSLKNPGSAVLRNLFKKSKLWIAPKFLTFTNEGSDYSQSPFRLLLDYILVSNSFRPVKGSIIHPDFTKRVDLGCTETPPKEDKSLMKKKKLVLVQFRTKTSKNPCYAYVDSFYKTLKTASDHYPLTSTLIFNP